MSGENRGAAASKPGRKSKDGGDQADALYTSDVFRMYCYKVLPCTKSYNHNWKVCPFAHEGEKARRRDPRAVRYVGIECPDSKSGRPCPRGDVCPFAHNVFEYWLHPTRYRTQVCNEPATCRRKVCFFAHGLEELRKPSLEEFATAPAPASARGSEEQAGGPLMVRAAGAMEAAAKAQEDLAQQQQAGLRLGLQGRSMMPSPYEQQDFAHRQAGLQAGESSVGGAPDPTAVDEALKDLAAWFNQQNSSSAAGPSQAHEGSQTVQLLTMLQELIKTQREGGQPPGSARASSLDLQQPRRQQQAHSSLYSRLSVDSITSQLQGQLCLGSHRPSPSVQALQREADPVQSGAMRVAVTSEGQGLLWDPGRSDLQRRLSLDSRHWGHQY